LQHKQGSLAGRAAMLVQQEEVDILEWQNNIKSDSGMRKF